MPLNIQNSFSQELPADPIQSNTRRQVMESCFSYVKPRKPSKPLMLHYSPEVARALGLSSEEMESKEMLDILTGEAVKKGTNPYAMCYGGHQFGHWAGQLGDGRAINLFEVVHDGKRWAMQLKGAGETPYSRSADGLAVLRSSIREHLCSEAMHHLGVPTTRSLSLALSGDEVLRDILYNGNSAYEPGAIVCRVAPSFIRFGNFQIFSARRDEETLKKLVDYTIKHFYTDIEIGTKEGYTSFFQEVANRTLDMVIHWQRVGFVHGVMNTDNMSILGLTIDYGPYGWLDNYDPDWTPNTTDRQERRYRYSQQPGIALWNLLQLANALFPLIKDAKPLEAILEGYQKNFAIKYNQMMLQKLGLGELSEENISLIKKVEKLLTLTETDMTIFYRNLSDLSSQKDYSGDYLSLINDAFYVPSELSDSIKEEWNNWFLQYHKAVSKEGLGDEERKHKMDLVNPKYVLRNYMAQMCIESAEKGNYTMIKELFELLKKPYDEQPENEKWYAKRPNWARDKVGCSMLSCSS